MKDRYLQRVKRTTFYDISPNGEKTQNIDDWEFYVQTIWITIEQYNNLEKLKDEAHKEEKNRLFDNYESCKEKTSINNYTIKDILQKTTIQKPSTGIEEINSNSK